MPIPDYQSVMLPLLSLLADGKEHHIRDVVSTLASTFQLTDAEVKELFPSGSQQIFRNRVGWAGTYLKKAGLLIYVRRGYLQITARGREALLENPKTLNARLLKKYPEFQDFQRIKRSPQDDGNLNVDDETSGTPEESVASGYLRLRKQVEANVLSRIKAAPPEFFERLVVLLLTTMGYGGSIADAGRALGKTGDGGIDGVIKEDKLGLDALYIQAKRWESTPVGRPEIQKFVGALHGRRARKGIFLTTSSFSKDAREYADSIETKVILIDGVQLTELMFDYGVGVSTINSYSIKRVDIDFFEETTWAE